MRSRPVRTPVNRMSARVPQRLIERRSLRSGNKFDSQNEFDYQIVIPHAGFCAPATRRCCNPQCKNDLLLQVRLLYAVRAIARPEQASHEVEAPYLGTHRF